MMKTLRKRLISKMANATYSYKRLTTYTSWGEKTISKCYVFQFKGGLEIPLGTRNDAYITPKKRVSYVTQYIGESEGRLKPKYNDSWY